MFDRHSLHSFISLSFSLSLSHTHTHTQMCTPIQVRKLKEWRKEATYWKHKCSKLGVTKTPRTKENVETTTNTPLRLSTNRKAVTPISMSKSKTMNTISSPIRVGSSNVSTPSSAGGWSKPLVNLRSGRRAKTPQSVVMRGG